MRDSSSRQLQRLLITKIDDVSGDYERLKKRRAKVWLQTVHEDCNKALLSHLQKIKQIFGSYQLFGKSVQTIY